MKNKANVDPVESEFSINTGHIYSDITLKWRKYPRELFAQLEDNLELILTNANIITAPWDKNTDYFESRIDRKIAREGKAETNLNFPPYFEYYVKHEDEGYSLTAFNSSYVLTKSSDPEYFSFFFALNLVILDPMKVNEFLDFHLQESFGGDFEKYKNYIFNLTISYSEILQNGKLDHLATLYIENKALKTKSKLTNDTLGVKRVLALYHLFNHIKLEARTGLARTRFISMVTGLSYDYVKKIIDKPLENKKSLKGQKEDFEYLIPFFEELKLDEVVQIFQKELNYINNNKNI